ncbi:hypothetical protein, variant [Aphanomyces astaci]|uniref:Kinesin motor domain-containing protein n=1 Tax=Aphanomyces astaci TaxID=112090 RepID=W4H8A3_APHAT|nr:hypothetical protein, variant [Aphanomyces astaci]ETV87353.1 hypothetical protein, variant [Aphanomyces astaci]|eukprot:XP_009822216.1 hypothetical protein, variant [Aphanomyces astaci]
MAVGVFLRADAVDGKVGLRRASNTCIRLEPSAMSPGVASINFDAVVEAPNPTDELFHQVVKPCLPIVCGGRDVSVIAAGCSASGKSHMMRGGTSTVGMVERCLEAMFDLVHDASKQDASRLTYIEMGCLWVQDTSDTNAATALQAVRTLNDALQLYEAHQRAMVATNAHSAVLCRVHSSYQHTVVVGSLALVDVNGASSMVALPCDPPSSTANNLELVIPHSSALTWWHSTYMGSSYVPCLLLGLRTHASCQQQVIQSLLYACRVKDIATRQKPCVVTLKADTGRTSPLSKIMMHLTRSATPESPCSPASKRFLNKYLPHVICANPSALAMDRRCMWPPEMLNTTFQPDHTSPLSPVMTTSSDDSDDESEQVVTTSQLPTKRSLDAALKALAAEKALTLRCAVRISQLNDMIKFQRAAQEKADADARAADKRLADSEHKLKLVQLMANQVQTDVTALKQRQDVVPSLYPSEHNTLTMSQFSSRLTKVIDETKQVVAMKDQYIAQLEQKVQDGAALLATAEAAAENERAARVSTASELEVTAAQLYEARRQLADQVAENSSLTSAIEASKLEAAARMQQVQAQHRRAVHVLEEKVAEQSQVVHRLKRQCDEVVAAEGIRWQAKIDALRSEQADKEQSRAADKEQTETLMAQHAAALDALTNDVASWETKYRDVVQMKEVVQSHLETVRLECAQLQTKVATLQEASAARFLRDMTNTKETVDQGTQHDDAGEEAPPTRGGQDTAADAMIQSMIAEVEQARKRDAHLSHALAMANRHEHEANVRLSHVQGDLHSCRRENLELLWVLHKREHSLRVLEQRHAFVMDRSNPSLS